jgi:ADP-ribose pyrophosphatase YjhB (NUDIX family)
MARRDPPGRRLEDYPHPSVAVDVALLTVAEDALRVLQMRGTDPSGRPAWLLPGGFVHPGERLAETVRRVLHDKCGLDGLQPRQLHVFDDPSRDPRGWVMSVAHAVTVRHADVSLRPDLRLVPASRRHSMPYDHDAIVERAAADLAERYADRPDPDRLLGPVFTVRDLQRVHEAVVGQTWHKDAFRRLMEPHLVPVPGKDRSEKGPPAQLYRRASDLGPPIEPSGSDDESGYTSGSTSGPTSGYTEGELLAAVADFVAEAERPTVEGYRQWARQSGQPSDAWVRRRLSDKYGGWPGIVDAARDPDQS